MDYYNKWMMRSCGESKFQAKTMSEKLVFSKFDILKSLPWFQEAFHKIDKDKRSEAFDVLIKISNGYDNSGLRIMASLDALKNFEWFEKPYSMVEHTASLFLIRDLIETDLRVIENESIFYDEDEPKNDNSSTIIISSFIAGAMAASIFIGFVGWNGF
jgi:hypothetical protein